MCVCPFNVLFVHAQYALKMPGSRTWSHRFCTLVFPSERWWWSSGRHVGCLQAGEPTHCFDTDVLRFKAVGQVIPNRRILNKKNRNRWTMMIRRIGKDEQWWTAHMVKLWSWMKQSCCERNVWIVLLQWYAADVGHGLKDTLLDLDFSSKYVTKPMKASWNDLQSDPLQVVKGKRFDKLVLAASTC